MVLVDRQQPLGADFNGHRIEQAKKSADGPKICANTRLQALNAQGGSRDQSGKDGGMCARNGDFGREVLKRGKGRKPRQHRGNGQKKSQPDQGWDFTLWWRWAESNRRPKVLRPRPYMLILAVRSRRRAARQAKRTRKPVC
ncbi:hypothetical protein XFLM_04850 [Xylella fastidiosa subsp. fastidiosa GB514]|nr:hypothetical protein XFLM_04850 [Xylella fastidiosa subsp. fastidiosa GB514]AIC14147.1 hypothetical protein P303_12170 [Xylella fastidiosa MUL0034]EWG14979.1 hypothetical protein P910_001737 [Xylella fastidiosa Mul-MD]KAF0571564.1 hypothetical protein P305_04040 [Xylella fastidiosa subsp. fastidiosa Mus-1]KGM19833.1 hypothetical protein JT24_11520 [Xylella fastidiosa]